MSDFKGRVEYPNGSSHDDRFGFVGDQHSGTLLCQWPGCGAEIFTDTYRIDEAADAHWDEHEPPIYLTRITVEIMGPRPFDRWETDDDPFGLLSLNEAITTGDCIGTISNEESDRVTPSEVVAELVRFGNDGTFFDPVD